MPGRLPATRPSRYAPAYAPLGDAMENVIVACASDLYDAPITELKDLLTPEAADYFPALKD